MKNFLLISCFIALTAIAAGAAPSCPSDTLWANENSITSYNFCVGTKTTTLECPAGRGFLSNSKYLGCVPFADWNCNIAKSGSEQTCQNGDNDKTPWAVEDPKKFNFCKTGQKVEESCAGTTLFFKDDKHLGCYPVAAWRSHTGCDA